MQFSGSPLKPTKGDTRESPAKFIAIKLIEEKAVLSITDPQALGNAQIDLAGVGGEITFEPNPYQAVEGASAIVVLTEWDLFKTLNYADIYNRMKKPALIFDGRNILEHQKLFAMGFDVYAIGKPGLTHF